MGARQLGKNYRFAYGGRLEVYKVEKLGGSLFCNHFAYEALTKEYNRLMRLEKKSKDE